MLNLRSISQINAAMERLDKETKTLVYTAIVFAGIFSVVAFTGVIGSLLVGTMWLLKVELTQNVQIVCGTVAIVASFIISYLMGKSNFRMFMENNGYE